ncbi:uncharacterized protein CIMG_13300 [Coccidioides immitis RS]|uniref:Uncharacterized protein n=1 Tax=Coccidioides immitis (strain RS) TaxID=246410 RepID=A0A0D8JUB3_COCIM|nr:uncharacterized protein CIMG_13300 [Coccidioides immitis RS]KJF60882.1 hypothetical protein CIMG_13300 [Coccidioides immitis RS]
MSSPDPNEGSKWKGDRQARDDMCTYAEQAFNESVRQHAVLLRLVFPHADRRFNRTFSSIDLHGGDSLSLPCQVLNSALILPSVCALALIHSLSGPADLRPETGHQDANGKARKPTLTLGRGCLLHIDS